MLSKTPIIRRFFHIPTEEFYANFNKLNDQYLEYYKGAYEEQKAIAEYEELMRKEQQKIAAHEEQMRKQAIAQAMAQFACPVCPKTWLTKQALEAHVSSNHRYEC